MTVLLRAYHVNSCDCDAGYVITNHSSSSSSSCRNLAPTYARLRHSIPTFEMSTVTLSIAPSFALSIHVYFRQLALDQYERVSSHGVLF